MRRPYTGSHDLRAMQSLVQRLWSPGSHWHVGDLAWGRRQHADREGDQPTALWRDRGGTVRAWGWVELPARPGHLELLVDPAMPELAGQVLDWFATVTPGPERTVTVAGEPHLTRALVEAGYERRRDLPWFLLLHRDLAELPPVPPWPRIRAVRDTDVPARVDVHRAAFAPSRVTVENYRAVRATWPYRPDLDRVVEAPGGSFAAFCLAWFDPDLRVGELEPVGTRPGQRRRGLATVASLSALHALRAAGARGVVVHARGDPGYPVPALLYGGLGFTGVGRTATYSRTG
jgi:ribosomal protein S18 acetylase RimI-like enzyme